MVRLEFSLRDLRNFLVRSKLTAFAGEGRRRKLKKMKIYSFSNGEWSYEDRYLGNLTDIGTEVVRYRGYPVWAMSYRGGIFADSRDMSSEDFRFLKKALRKVSKRLPARGPRTFSEGAWCYLNSCEGDIADFWGIEYVTYKGRRVYDHRYFGGLVRDHSFSVSITRPY
jgi:hypothetical protein